MPHGGDYDGVAGVVVPLEILRAAAEEDKRRPVPLELIIFAEEEGTTLRRLGMLGSRAWVGDLTEEQLANVHNNKVPVRIISTPVRLTASQKKRSAPNTTASFHPTIAA